MNALLWMFFSHERWFCAVPSSPCKTTCYLLSELSPPVSELAEARTVGKEHEGQIIEGFVRLDAAVGRRTTFVGQQPCQGCTYTTNLPISVLSLQKWYACVANAEFMLNDIQNESFAEQLREKTRFYKENDYELDFFMVCEPAWLEQQHPEMAKKVGRPCVALVGTEENWIRCETCCHSMHCAALGVQLARSAAPQCTAPVLDCLAHQ